MLRKLVVAMTIAGALNQAHALGLGEIRLKSALNQPLDAEIELVQVRNLSSNEILPNLATRNDFIRAGVERPFFLSSLKFRSVVRADGTAYIRVTSDRPVQEPFLNFLMEVHWPRGRLLREYTLLVDPPVFSGDAATAVNAPSRGNPLAAAPAGNARQGSYQQQSYGQKPVSPVAPAVAAPGYRAPQQTGQVNRQTPAPAAVQTRKPLQSNYYRVGSNDSLWNIANQVRPDQSVNLQQTMVAIQRANPRAFMSGNINRLMRGQVLRLPSREEIAAVRQSDAKQSIARQNDQWQGKQQQLDATPRQQPEASPRSVPVESQLKIVNAADEEQGHRGAENNAQQPSASQQGNSDLENRLTLAMERMDRLADENQDLTSRLGDLDEQIRTLEKLVSLKDEQLAMLQAELAKRDQQLAGAQNNAQNNMAMPSPQAPAMTPEPAMAPPAKEIDYNYQSDEEAKQAQQSVQPKATQAEPGPKPKHKPKPRPQTPPPQPKHVMDDDLLSNPLYLGGLGTLLLALMGMLVYRKRKSADAAAKPEKTKAKAEPEKAEGEQTADEAPATEENKKPSFMDSLRALKDKLNVDLSLDALKQKFAFGKNKQADKPLEEEDENAPVPLFADLPDKPQVAETGLKPSTPAKQQQAPVAVPTKETETPEISTEAEAEAEQTPEPEQEVAQQTDGVLSEADIYIAYGRLPQAADLLSAAINSEPERTDLRLKLMEVYVESGEQAPFTAQMDALKGIGDEAALAKADELSSRFNGGVAVSGGSDGDFALSEDDLADIELDLGLDEAAGDPPIDDSVAVDAPTENQGGDELDDLDLSFDDLDLEESEPEQPRQPEPTAEQAEVTAAPPEPPQRSASPLPPPAAAPDDDLNSMELEDLDLDLDLALDADTVSPQDSAAFSEEADLQALDSFELDEGAVAAGSDASLDGVGIDVELDQLNKDLGQLSDELDGGAAVGETSGFNDDISELDELSLELDEDLVTGPVNEINLDEELPSFEADDAALEDDLEESGNDFEFLAGTDEASTKLDLARAYMDMDDAAGAKEILGEVLQEGNETQQKEARDLLARLEN